MNCVIYGKTLFLSALLLSRKAQAASSSIASSEPGLRCRCEQIPRPPPPSPVRVSQRPACPSLSSRRARYSNHKGTWIKTPQTGWKFLYCT
ncbi:hypothetical protein GOP47_0025651 [Adiantum capillus-veneris]|uniref:Secreted protein n=1 Tax=Adiantum capillus-veneris TaxID=13818 RepID=A0A9D4Z3R4_ADICA|nr:hypothetical protein GOP47_0025651 [Adiantum capillus-veneris]